MKLLELITNKRKKYWIRVGPREWNDAKHFYGARLASREKELMYITREDLYREAIRNHPEWKMK